MKKQPLTVRIDSSCAMCGQALTIEVTDRLDYTVRRGPQTILVFEPEIDWSAFTAPTIVDDYCMNSLFFCSEEHAARYRASRRQIDGHYLTLAQSAFSTRHAQGALFGFDSRT